MGNVHDHVGGNLHWMLKKLVLLLLVGDGVWSCLAPNLKNCQLCSDQDDVPCILELRHYTCHPSIPDTNQTWPGSPVNLRAKAIPDDSGAYRAEFTWQAPYDSSIESLRGFHLLVHCNDRRDGVMGLPSCFYANLTDRTWAQRARAHETQFKFTCMRSYTQTTVSVYVTSIPRPPKHFKNTISNSITLPGQNPMWKPHIDTEVVQKNGRTNLKVRFQPLYPQATAHKVVLALGEKDINHTFVKAPQNSITFYDVKGSDNYTIWLRPVNNKTLYMVDHYLSSKYFSVPENKKAALVSSEQLKISTLVLVPVLLLVTISGTIVFFLRKKGKPQLFKSMRYPDNDEHDEAGAPNNQPSIVMPQGPGDSEVTTFHVLCSQQNTAAEKVSRLFIKFIESKTEFQLFDDSDSAVEDVLVKWKSANGISTLIILLSDDIIGMLDKIKRALKHSDVYQLGTMCNLIDLLLEIDSSASDRHLPSVMLVCIHSDLCPRFLELLPNLGQIYSIVDDLDGGKCQLRSGDLEQLFVSIQGYQQNLDIDYPIVLSRSSLSGCTQTKLLLAGIQQLLDARKRPQQYRPLDGTEEVALKTTTYQHMGDVPNMAVHPLVPIQANSYGDRYARQTQSPYWENPGMGQPYTMYINGPRQEKHTNGHCESIPYSQTDSGFDTMTPSHVDEEVPFLSRPGIPTYQKGSVSHLLTRQIEPTQFLSPESDDEFDGVSLSQRISELNQRQTKNWNNGESI